MPLLQITDPTEEIEDKTSAKVIGIDFGTSNSLIAYCDKNEKTNIIPDQNGKNIIPSIISCDKNGQILIGNEAKKGDNIISSIKRIIGKKFNEINNIKQLPFEIFEEDSQTKVKFGAKNLTATEISTIIISRLKEIAEDHFKEKIENAVITVPAYFNEKSKSEVKKAAKIAGLNVLRLLNEPTAAALAYGLDNNSKGTYLIYDLGGGTFDISILKLTNGIFRVLGVSGDSDLGGDDFDKLIYDKIIFDLKLNNLNQTQKITLKTISKEIKEKFLTSNQIHQNININNKNHEFSLNIEEFKKLSEDLINRTSNLTQNLIEELKLQKEDIDGVILVGGSTKLPLISQKLSDIYGSDKIFTNLNPDEIVAIGAAIQAHSLTFGSKNLLLDVVPLSIGLETMGGIIEKIIHRNSPIPIGKSKEFTTYADGQTGMKFHIVQGEREFAKDAISLTKFEIKNLPNKDSGQIKVRVEFNIDADGLLTISAFEQESGQEKTVEINWGNKLDEKEIKKALLEANKNAKSDIKARLEAESISEGKRVVAKIKDMFED
ncbi:Hsp70 family protein [Rickettsiales bacterium]|nr:Hsp70 family protein [Rickettsiales bacterium]MDB2550853.1 Hsp70 family protein [Rickettsiales bacterium]